jgi:hypothetical protein
MARIEGVDAKKAPLLVRLAYWFCRRKVGRVVEPVRIHAHHTRLLRGLAGMEMAQEAARTVDPLVKTLAQVRAATRIGCPF